MSENRLVTGDSKGIVLVPREIIEEAVLKSDFALSTTLKSSLRNAQTPADEIRIYAATTGILFELRVNDTISQQQFDRRFSTLVGLDTTSVDADHQVVPTAPTKKARKDDDVTASHGRIVQMFTVGLAKDPDTWEQIMGVVSTNQMEQLGRFDLLSCPSDRMSQYIANAVFRAHDGYSYDWSDVNFLIQTALDRDEEFDPDGDFLEEVRETLEKDQPGAYRTLLMKAKATHADWLIDFLSEEVVDDYEFDFDDDDDDEFYD